MSTFDAQHVVSGFPVLCYSSVFGGFERVWPALEMRAEWKYCVISDENLQLRGYQTVVIPAGNFGSPRLANRYQKMLFGTDDFLGVSIYVDANVRILRDLKPLVDEFVKSGADMGMYRHYARHSVAAEAEACVRRKKVDNPANVELELAHYESAGFKDDRGMWEASVILKNHRSRKLEPAMSEWWSLYSRFQTRDQFSLPFIIWKNEIEVFDMELMGEARDTYFARLPHASVGTFNRLSRWLRARSLEGGFWRLFRQPN